MKAATRCSAHADRGDFRRRHPQRHLVLDEVDDEQFELGAGDLLLLDRYDLPDAVRRVHDELVGLEPLSLSGLFDGHYRGCSFVGLAADCGLGNGSPAARRRARNLRCPPDTAGFLGPPGHGGGLFGPVTRFSCHGHVRGSHALFVTGSSETTPKKTRSPLGAARMRGFSLIRSIYSTFSAEFKALQRRKTVFQAC